MRGGEYEGTSRLSPAWCTKGWGMLRWLCLPERDRVCCRPWRDPAPIRRIIETVSGEVWRRMRLAGVLGSGQDDPSK
jgi:hypothetical protein